MNLAVKILVLPKVMAPPFLKALNSNEIRIVHYFWEPFATSVKNYLLT